MGPLLYGCLATFDMAHHLCMDMCVGHTCRAGQPCAARVGAGWWPTWQIVLQFRLCFSKPTSCSVHQIAFMLALAGSLGCPLICAG